MTDLEFRTLFERARKRNRMAEERLFEIALEMAIASARKRLRPRDRALLESRDLGQSLMLRLHLKLPELSFDRQAALGGWVAAAMENLLREKRRAAGRLRRDVDRNVPWPSEGIPAEVLESIGSVLSRREQIERLLSHLSEEQAAVVRLHALEGRTFSEIAEALSISKDAAERRYYRAIASLAMAPPEVASSVGLLTIQFPPS